MITYRRIKELPVAAFIDILKRSTMAERRPTDNTACMKGMAENGNLTIGAYQNEKLVGLARSVTDFHYCCYLSELAVDTSLQGKGIGKELVRETKACLQPTCNLILLSAPKASAFYPQNWLYQTRKRLVVVGA